VALQLLDYAFERRWHRTPAGRLPERRHQVDGDIDILDGRAAETSKRWTSFSTSAKHRRVGSAVIALQLLNRADAHVSKRAQQVAQAFGG